MQPGRPLLEGHATVDARTTLLHRHMVLHHNVHVYNLVQELHLQSFHNSVSELKLRHITCSLSDLEYRGAGPISQKMKSV